jgi:hypothetical protein
MNLRSADDNLIHWSPSLKELTEKPLSVNPVGRPLALNRNAHTGNLICITADYLLLLPSPLPGGEKERVRGLSFVKFAIIRDIHQKKFLDKPKKTVIILFVEFILLNLFLLILF